MYAYGYDTASGVNETKLYDNFYKGVANPNVGYLRICNTSWKENMYPASNTFNSGAVRKYAFTALPESNSIQLTLGETASASVTMVAGSIFIVKGEKVEKLPSDRIFNWIDRAENVLKAELNYSKGIDEFNAAVEAMYNADSTSNDDALIADLKAAWNNLTYVDGTKTYKLSLADYGDVNGDGSIDVRDIVRSKKYLAGITNEISDYSLDMNDDGRNAVDDLVAIRNKILNG